MSRSPIKSPTLLLPTLVLTKHKSHPACLMVCNPHSLPNLRPRPLFISRVQISGQGQEQQCQLHSIRSAHTNSILESQKQDCCILTQTHLSDLNSSLVFSLIPDGNLRIVSKSFSTCLLLGKQKKNLTFCVCVIPVSTLGLARGVYID
jgi:hypothetical protein